MIKKINQFLAWSEKEKQENFVIVGKDNNVVRFNDDEIVVYGSLENAREDEQSGDTIYSVADFLKRYYPHYEHQPSYGEYVELETAARKIAEKQGVPSEEFEEFLFDFNDTYIHSCDLEDGENYANVEEYIKKKLADNGINE